MISGLANYNFHIHYKSRKSNVEADALSRIDWEKCDKTIQADSIQATVAAAITGQGNNHIEAIPVSPQTVDSLMSSIPDDIHIVSKTIAWSSRQSHATQLETKLSITKTESKPDNSSHLLVDEDLSLNSKCMTRADWIEAQYQDKIIGKIIWMLKAEELQNQKGKETDSQEMRQFIRQQSKLFLRNGMLYHKNEIQEVDHPDRNTM